MNGFGFSITNLTMPRAMRLQVFSASGFLRSKMEGQGNRPVDDLGRSAPRQALAAEHLGRAGLAVGRLRPDDRLTVAARDHEEALADGGRAIIAGAKLLELEPVAEPAQLPAPFLESLAGARLDRVAVVVERAPGAELLDILEEDHARAHPLAPEHDDPGEIADALLARLAALRLGEVLAVGAEPGELDRAAAGRLERVDLPDVVANVPGAGVVDLVHPDRFFIVVDRDIDGAAERLLDPGRGAAAAGEIVDDDPHQPRLTRPTQISTQRPSQTSMSALPFASASRRMSPPQGLHWKRGRRGQSFMPLSPGA
jgi:hypothetical protein